MFIDHVLPFLSFLFRDLMCGVVYSYYTRTYNVAKWTEQNMTNYGIPATSKLFLHTDYRYEPTTFRFLSIIFTYTGTLFAVGFFPYRWKIMNFCQSSSSNAFRRSFYDDRRGAPSPWPWKLTRFIRLSEPYYRHKINAYKFTFKFYSQRLCDFKFPSDYAKCAENFPRLLLGLVACVCVSWKIFQRFCIRAEGRGRKYYQLGREDVFYLHRSPSITSCKTIIP